MSLRNDLIRLAQAIPETRGALIPLLHQAADRSQKDYFGETRSKEHPNLYKVLYTGGGDSGEALIWASSANEAYEALKEGHSRGRSVERKKVMKMARVTAEDLRVKYVNMGDFGGTDPIEDSFVLTVAGPTFEYRDTLKRLGLVWDPRSKDWSIRAVLYRNNTRARQAEWVRKRQLQERAWPEIQQLAKEHNDRNREESQSRALSVRELEELSRRLQRMAPQIEAAGLRIKDDMGSRYDIRESRIIVTGNTYPYVDLMRKYGFRWDPGLKGWTLPYKEYMAVGHKWMGEVIRMTPTEPEEIQPTPLSDMSPAELAKFVDAVVIADMEANDFYDGETTGAKIKQHYLRQIRALKPENEDAFYQKALKMISSSGHSRWIQG